MYSRSFLLTIISTKKISMYLVSNVYDGHNNARTDLSEVSENLHQHRCQIHTEICSKIHTSKLHIFFACEDVSMIELFLEIKFYFPSSNTIYCAFRQPGETLLSPIKEERPNRFEYPQPARSAEALFCNCFVCPFREVKWRKRKSWALNRYNLRIALFPDKPGSERLLGM